MFVRNHAFEFSTAISVIAVAAHLLDPATTSAFVGKAEPIKALANRFDAGEAKHAALKTAQSVGAEIPAIKKDRHAIVTRAERPANSHFHRP